MNKLFLQTIASLTLSVFAADGAKAAPIPGLEISPSKSPEKPKPTTPPSSAPKPATVQAAQAEAMRLYPDIAKAGSAANALFVKIVQEAKRSNDPVMSQPDWPLVLAKRAMLPSPSPSPVPPRGKANVSEVSFVGIGNGRISRMAIQKDGKILVMGRFESVDGVPTKGFARLNPDGTLDGTFKPDAHAEVTHADQILVQQADGKVLVGGKVGKETPALERLNADGTRDKSFKSDWNVWATLAAELPSGKILFAGTFSPVEGSADQKNQLICLNIDGTEDSSFRALEHAVYCTAIQEDGKIVVGGLHHPHNAVRITPDGKLDPSFTVETEGAVTKIAIQKDGKLLVRGQFTTINGVARPGFARLNADGTVDRTFNPKGTSVPQQPGVSAPPIVDNFAVQESGDIVIQGRFNAIDGVRRTGLARLKPDGTLDPTFAPDILFPSDCAAQADGKLLVVGRFQGSGKPQSNAVFRLNPDGSLDQAFGKKP